MRLMSGTTISAGRRRPLVRNKDVDRYTVAHKTRTRWRPRAPTNHGIRGIEFPSSKTLRKSLFWPVTEPTCKRLVLAPIWKTKPFFPWIFPFGHDPVSHVPRCRVPNKARRSNIVLFVSICQYMFCICQYTSGFRIFSKLGSMTVLFCNSDLL